MKLIDINWLVEIYIGDKKVLSISFIHASVGKTWQWL